MLRRPEDLAVEENHVSWAHMYRMMFVAQIGFDLGRGEVRASDDRNVRGPEQFQDLGLLIVDEEQRFGVRHKERLKQMRAAMKKTS